MGKKPVLGIVSALCVGLALTGCRNCSSCHSDSGQVAKGGTVPAKPQAAFSQNGLPAASAPAGWNNPGPSSPKPSAAAPTDVPSPLGMDKPVMKSSDPLASSKPAPFGVQPASFAAPAPDANTSRFAPTAAGRILPTPPALVTGASLPPLGEQRPFTPKVEESTMMPPPPPPPPSMPRSPSFDSTPLPTGTPPPPPPGPNG